MVVQNGSKTLPKLPKPIMKWMKNLEEYVLQIFTPWNLRGLGIAGSLQGKSALSMKKGCKNCKKKHDNYRIYNHHGVSPQFLQPFSVDSADFPCRYPAIPSPRSFHGVISPPNMGIMI